MKELREYQQNIVNDILASERDIVVCLPTGSGKTVIAAALIESIQGQVVFIVPRLELIKQAAREFGEVDIIWSDQTKLSGKHCIIASKDSLRTQYSKLSDELRELIREGTVIIDEAHVSLEQSYKLVSMLNPKRIIGLTATPERMDGQALLKGSDQIHKFGIFDELMQSETVASLIRKGYLSPLKYYAKPIEGISEIKPDNVMSEELSDRQMMEIFNNHNIWGDLVKSYEEYGKGRPALGFTTTVAMGELVAKIFNDAGYDFRVIHGEMPVKERQYLIDALRNRDIDGLVNASLLTYGFDCPPASYAFNCRHIKSRPLWFQIVGRILRPCEGKENAIFVDHADSISEFSDPDCSLPILDEAVIWRVDGESKAMRQKRKKALKKVQETMELIQELDPIPAELVEITTENTWERLVKIIKKLRAENALLNKNIVSLQDGQEKLKDRVAAETLKNQQLMKENEQIKKIKATPKVVDSDKTFDYVKSHYIYYRQQVENNHDGISRIDAHKLVERKIRADEPSLAFIFDQAKLIRGLDYWFEHYETKIAESR